ncbi:MAG: 6-phosphofructokinase, partial [Magnetococcales bacterium]|nr:6-phosphofructokinase [Magnetococcales bacterium]
DLDNRALPGIYVAVVMGRHAGFLTAASAMARQHPDDGPHLIYLPERSFDEERFLSDVKQVYDRLGRCVIAVSEGIHDTNGQPIVTRLQHSVERDAHGNVQLSGTGALADLLTGLIKNRLGIKRVRGDTLGYLQRSFAGVVSTVDQSEAREVGEKAIQFGYSQGESGSVTIHRIGNYQVDYRLVPLSSVAGKTRVMPTEFIDDSGSHVTAAFCHYLAPLLGAPLAVTARLRAPMVLKQGQQRS